MLPPRTIIIISICYSSILTYYIIIIIILILIIDSRTTKVLQRTPLTRSGSTFLAGYSLSNFIGYAGERGLKFAARRDMLTLNSRMRVASMALVALLGPTMAVAAPNIVVVLADDLDQTLGSAGLALNKTREIIGGNGATAKNWFAHTPICCPSRAEILTGRYFHNLRTASPQDQGCMHINVSRNASSSEFYSKFYFATHFQKLGYTVGLFGKHLNSANSAKAPPGVDRWFVNGGGNYFNPTFTDPSGRGARSSLTTVPQQRVDVIHHSYWQVSRA